MRKWRASFAFATLIGILSAGNMKMAMAADITVCPSGCSYSTVQDGLNAAGVGDRVVVGTPGRKSAETYTTNIQMKNGVTLVSEGDDSTTLYNDPLGGTGHASTVLKRATLTILHGAGEIPVVRFDSASGAVLDGFIIENIAPTATEEIPLVSVVDSSPTIQNNIVRDNQGPQYNSGIMVEGGLAPSTPLIQNNVIHYVNGAGIMVHSQGVPEIIGNDIFTSPPSGVGNEPGIGLRDDSAATILNNNLFSNNAAGIGSKLHGIRNSGFPLVIKGNEIYNNDTAGISIVGQSGAGVADQVEVTIGGPNPEDSNNIYGNITGIRMAIPSTLVYRLGTAVIENNSIHNNQRTGLRLQNLVSLTVKNNTVFQNKSGLLLSFNDTCLVENNDIENNLYSGIAFRNSRNWVQDVQVTNNEIEENGYSGIRIDSAAIDGVIANNEISDNMHGGIMFMRSSSTFEIIDNEIEENTYGGIHTGKQDFDDGSTIFFGTIGDLHLTIRGNKVHHNGQGDYGGGIDVRHAAGTIENNLVYRNNRSGIRFYDYITAVNNNTVAYNGLSGVGGGIVYDDLTGDLISLPSGFLVTPIPIRNNILVGNATAGIMTGGTNDFTKVTCDILVGYRDYNLVSANNGAPESSDGYTGIGWWRRQLGSCDPNPHEIWDIPEFVNFADDDYRLLLTSPAVDSGDPAYPDAFLPPGVGTHDADMGAYGGPNGMDW